MGRQQALLIGRIRAGSYDAAIAFRGLAATEAHVHVLAPVSYTHLTLPTNREV